MNAPFQPAALDVRGLALALLRDACGEEGLARLHPEEAEGALLRLKAAPAAQDETLVRLSRRFGLSDGELLTAGLCLAAETDPQAARLIAAAQAPVGGSRPLAGFAATLFAGFGLDCASLAAGAAVRIGLFTVGSEDAPLPERSLIMAAPVAAALAEHRLEPEGISPLNSAPTRLPAAVEARAAAEAERLYAASGARALVVQTACIRESEAVAKLVAAALGLTPVLLDEAQPPRHCAWLAASAALPVLRRSLGPGESWRLDSPGSWDGPLLILTGLEGLVEAPYPVTEWRIGIPDEAERTALWRDAGLGQEDAALAARTYRQGAGRIAGLAERIAVSPRQDWGALADAVETGACPLDALARRSRARVEREDLVIPEELAGALDRLVGRVSHRNRLAEGLAPALRARYRPGVRALFTGESGTGKTLAAHWLARQCGLPLYRVDLAAMTSKWIGETEKNISATLDAAEQADVLLFFDEADALFGARTDVSDSNDRFANAQTNYLLQRIEEFDGVAILATNGRDRFDPAFVRRLDAILEFPLPDPAARRALWRAHLGEDHSIDEGVLDSLSLAIDLAGGHIRNIALSAASRALATGRFIAEADIAEAAAEEYAKLGRSPPPLGRW